VQPGGNLKYDIRAAKPAAVTTALEQYLAAGANVLVCGSTLEDEERMLLDAMPPGVVMVLAPRHPERFEAVAQLLQERGAPWLRRSLWITAPVVIEAGTVFLLDSIGELASVYSLASVAFVGGSLVNTGGHNPLEPAQFGVPVVMGPSYENFRGIVEQLLQHDAIRIVPAENLKAEIATLLADPSLARAVGARARDVCEREAGATGRAVNALVALAAKTEPTHAAGVRA
jgi:3-deoxy-D-manno-octulosonic-acid transferase